eukprot:TRINITY_DN6319_c0_g1_i1.p2 TRINITY_DN6319_c0_g1~~TRINITY_DN6319_c0_g1_i1.p2  ORF type:complete len:143 (+),score=27.74 TRINITY_DN6319_c0_g1_i1:996-1424(+)
MIRETIETCRPNNITKETAPNPKKKKRVFHKFKLKNSEKFQTSLKATFVNVLANLEQLGYSQYAPRWEGLVQTHLVYNWYFVRGRECRRMEKQMDDEPREVMEHQFSEAEVELAVADQKFEGKDHSWPHPMANIEQYDQDSI